MESHLLQMRGLKHDNEFSCDKKDRSHLLQMRGLKPKEVSDVHPAKRRIFYRCVD